MRYMYVLPLLSVQILILCRVNTCEITPNAHRFSHRILGNLWNYHLTTFLYLKINFSTYQYFFELLK